MVSKPFRYLELEDVCVDDNILGVYAEEYLKKYGYMSNCYHTPIEVPKGSYEVLIRIKGTPRGNLEGTAKIEDTSSIIVGDPYYGFDPTASLDWALMLKETQGLTLLEKGCGKTLVTGADGVYAAQVTIDQL